MLATYTCPNCGAVREGVTPCLDPEPPSRGLGGWYLCFCPRAGGRGRESKAGDGEGTRMTSPDDTRCVRTANYESDALRAPRRKWTSALLTGDGGEGF